MTCNFCGSILDDNEIECPYCGHKTGVTRPEEVYDDPAEGEFYEGSVEGSGESFGEGSEKGSEEAFEESFAVGDEPVRPRTRATAPSGKSSRPAGKGAGFNVPKLNLKGGLEKLSRLGGKKSSTGREETEQGKRKASGAGRFRSGLNLANPGMLPLIVFAACALLCIICLISTLSLRAKVNDNYQALLSQIMQLQNTDQQLSAEISNVSRTTSNAVNMAVSQVTSTGITITKEPTSTATYLGRGGEQDSSQNVPIFTVSATGSNLSFTWQKFDDASGVWVDLVFDGDSNNTALGLHVYTDVSKGYSELAAHGVAAAAYGTYRCTVSDATGSRSTDNVELTQRSNG